MLTRFTNIISLLTFILFPSVVEAQNYGLGFSSVEVPKELRTGLNLSPEKDFNFTHDFDLSFDFFANPNIRSSFGYIFRIFFNDSSNIDFVYNYRVLNTKDFTLVSRGKATSIAFNIDQKKLYNNWNHFSVDFDFNAGIIKIIAGDSVYTAKGTNISDKTSFHVFFGACSYHHFISTDVPKMFLKDIKIYNRGKLKYYWPLNNYTGKVTTDVISGRKAIVNNPKWLRNLHYSWQNIYEAKMQGCAQIAVNEHDEIIYLIGSDRIIAYSATNNTTETYDLEQKPSLLQIGSQAIYINSVDEIYLYNYQQKKISEFNFQDNEFLSVFSDSLSATNHWHHNKFYYAKNHKIYFFGGYGLHKYDDDVNAYDINSKIWDTVKYSGSIFNPRYLAACGYLNDTVYILGGFGSPSGLQMLNPKHYYDLLSFSLKDQVFNKKFEISNQGKEFCFANSMVIDSVTRNYYALAFPEYNYSSHLQLIKGSLDKPGFDYMGDSIPYDFLDIRSYADLFLFKKSKKLFAVTTLLHDTSSTDIKLYSLLFPPDKILKNKPSKSGVPFSLLTVIFIVIFTLGISMFYYFRKRGSRVKLFSRAEPPINMKFFRSIIRMKDTFQTAFICSEVSVLSTRTGLILPESFLLCSRNCFF